MLLLSADCNTRNTRNTRYHSSIFQHSNFTVDAVTPGTITDLIIVSGNISSLHHSSVFKELQPLQIRKSHTIRREAASIEVEKLHVVVAFSEANFFIDRIECIIVGTPSL